MKVKLFFNLPPFHSAIEKNKSGDFRYRWANALTGEITIDSCFHRIICWPGASVLIDGKMHLVKFSAKPGEKPWMNAIRNRDFSGHLELS